MIEQLLSSEDLRGRTGAIRRDDIAAIDEDFNAHGRVGVTLKNGSRTTLSLTQAKSCGFKFREDAPPLDGGSVQASALARDWLLGLARRGFLTVPKGGRPTFMGGNSFTDGATPGAN